MIGKIGWFLLLGFVWLFIFSIPVSKDRRVFDVGFNLVVDTLPVNWAVNSVQNYIDATKGAGSEKTHGTFAKSGSGRHSSL